MLVESFAIVAVLIVMAAMLAKAGKRTFAAFTLPLASIPLLHLAGIFLRLQAWIVLFDVAGLLLGVLLCFLFSRSFASRRGRVGYLVFCYFFMVLLLVAYLLNLS